MTCIGDLDVDYVHLIVSVERYLEHILSNFMGSKILMIHTINELDESLLENSRLFSFPVQIAIYCSFVAD